MQRHSVYQQYCNDGQSTACVVVNIFCIVIQDFYRVLTVKQSKVSSTGRYIACMIVFDSTSIVDIAYSTIKSK